MTLVTVAGALCVTGLIWAERYRPALRPPAKLAASAGFVVAALLGGATDSGYGRWVLAALLLSALGDAFLLSRSSRGFLGGLGAFLLGHLAYSAAFGARGIDHTVSVLALVVLALPAVAVVRWLWPSAPAALRGPVTGYAAVITVMVAAALGTAVDDPGQWILIAAVAFYLSDLAVARDRFVSPGFGNKLWGLPLYYAAQYLFAWTV